MDFTLRPWTMADIDSLVKYANNVNIARWMTDAFPHPYSAENGRAFIMFANHITPIHIFAIDVAGEAVGGIGIHPQTDVHRKNIELGYWLAEPFWGNGIVTRAVNQMVDFAFSSYDITRVFARPFGHNAASQRVLQKAGFVLEATFDNALFKNGEFADEMIYAVRRG